MQLKVPTFPSTICLQEGRINAKKIRVSGRRGLFGSSCVVPFSVRLSPSKPVDFSISCIASALTAFIQKNLLILNKLFATQMLKEKQKQTSGERGTLLEVFFSVVNEVATNSSTGNSLQSFISLKTFREKKKSGSNAKRQTTLTLKSQSPRSIKGHICST